MTAVNTGVDIRTLRDVFVTIVGYAIYMYMTVYAYMPICNLLIYGAYYRIRNDVVIVRLLQN